jgi:hypothetical protein
MCAPKISSFITIMNFYKVLVLIILVFIFVLIKYSDEPKKATIRIQSVLSKDDEKIVVSVFNFSKPIESHNANKYFSIECRKSAKVLDAVTTLCIHSVKSDIYISGKIYS